MYVVIDKLCIATAPDSKLIRPTFKRAMQTFIWYVKVNSEILHMRRILSWLNSVTLIFLWVEIFY